MTPPLCWSNGISDPLSFSLSFHIGVSAVAPCVAWGQAHQCTHHLRHEHGRQGETTLSWLCVY
jgi:hypothetical protein